MREPLSTECVCSRAKDGNAGSNYIDSADDWVVEKGMGRKDEKKWKTRGDRVREFWEIPPADSGQEKNRARDLRQTSWWRQRIAKGVCYYCGRQFCPDDLTMDHLIPLSRGGRSERSNIVPSCKECNNKKKYLLPSEWTEYVEHIQKESSTAPCGETDSSDDEIT
ncbi:MAG: HNH endonuclease [Spirochaetota bacterium]